MPIYEYFCPKCDQVFETLVMNNKEKVSCPQCECKGVKRVLSGFAHKSEGKMVSSNSGCATCSGGSCATCH